MAREREHFEDEDDGRTIADMSDVRSAVPFTLHRANREEDVLPDSTRDVREELGDPDERPMVLLGSLKAALSVGLVYVVVFGLFIALLLYLWC